MSKKTFQFVTTLIGSLGAIASACVTYFVEDKGSAAEIVGAIGVGVTAAEAICAKFVKEQ